jgi:molybdopterin-guanine dinucleotide biosynthesis protein A
MNTPTTPYPISDITGVVLAGGQGRRMGGVDKGLTTLTGRPMAAYAVDALRAQSVEVLINANRNRADYEALGCRVVADEVGDYFGPLAGMASAMRAVKTPYVLFAPCDSPLVSTAIGPRLWTAIADGSNQIAVASDGERHQPVFALMSTTLADSAFEFLASGERKIDRWYDRVGWAIVECSDLADSFININRHDDREALESTLRNSTGPPT